MLSKEDNELVTNTDKGTPMGEVMRRYWIPVALSEELPGPDCVPVKLKIMNEELIAFRDSDGNVGLVDAYCPHRGAPMFFGRNEECGSALRLPRLEVRRHGSVRRPAEHARRRHFQEQDRGSSPTPARKPAAWSSPTWARARSSRPFPEFDFLHVPSPNIYVTKFQLECNWLQATEGDFDPSHALFLHSTLDNNASNPGRRINAGNNTRANLSGIQNNNPLAAEVNEEEPFPFAVGNRRFKAGSTNSREATELHDVDGAMYAVQKARRNDGSEVASLTLRHIMPIYCPPGVSRPGHFSNNMRVPIDNYHMMFFRLRWALDADDERGPGRIQAGRLCLPGDGPRHLEDQGQRLERL